MQRLARSTTGGPAAMMRALALIAAALIALSPLSACAGRVVLSGEGPLLPRAVGPQSARDLVPPIEEADASALLESASTEDEREGATPEERPGTLHAFLDEILQRDAVLRALPKYMGITVRRTFLEDRAIRTYREGILRFPESSFVPSAHIAIASIYARRGEVNAALAQYQTLLDRFPAHERADDARLARARLLYDGADYAGAAKEAYLLIDGYLDSPLVPDAYLLAARVHEGAEGLDAARRAYEHVLERTTRDDPRSAQARAGLAALELAAGNAERAVELYEALLAEAPTQAVRDERQYSLACVYLDMGARARGRKMLREILDGYPLNAYRDDARYRLADSYYEDGKMPQAVQSYANALTDFPYFAGRIDALFRAAEAYQRLMLYADALATVRRVAASHDPSPTLHERARAALIAGELCFLDGNFDAALVELYRALVGKLAEPERHRAMYRIAQCYYRNGYYSEALEQFHVALEQAPQHALAFQASVELAGCYEKKGWLDDARQRYWAVLEAADEDDPAEQAAVRAWVVGRLLDTYGNQSLHQGELDCARRVLERQYPFLDEASVLYRMGRAYEQLNNLTQAAATYAQVRSRFPGTPWAEGAAVKMRHMEMLKRLEALAH